MSDGRCMDFYVCFVVCLSDSNARIKIICFPWALYYLYTRASFLLNFVIFKLTAHKISPSRHNKRYICFPISTVLRPRFVPATPSLVTAALCNCRYVWWTILRLLFNTISFCFDSCLMGDAWIFCVFCCLFVRFECTHTKYLVPVSIILFVHSCVVFVEFLFFNLTAHVISSSTYIKSFPCHLFFGIIRSRFYSSLLPCAIVGMFHWQSWGFVFTNNQSYTHVSFFLWFQ